MELSKLVKSADYLDAKAKVSAWMSLLGAGGKAEAGKVLEEKARFFGEMKKERPGLYLAFRISDKALSEMAYEKLSGRKISLE
ncbi:MAG TPA: hypothetical protein VLD37_00670 [Candidatus Bilamarchaeum sp.]|nr:hypothetical protein [Candidatus Bilamarchaeum sp.]